MLTHYLYSLDTKTVYAFLEGKDADSDVTVIKTRAMPTKDQTEHHPVTMSAQDALDLRFQLIGRGFCSYEQFRQRGTSFYNVYAEQATVPYFRSGLCRRQDLEELRERFFRDFHPAGYSSYVKVDETDLNDVVFWSASRARSCD